MKKVLVIVLAVILAVSCVAIGVSASASQVSADDVATGEPICGADQKTVSPIAEYDSLEEAGSAIGIEMSAPEMIDGYNRIDYTTVCGNLVQIDYRSSAGADICIRKGEGNDDVSGDYNVYDESVVVMIGGREVTVQGNGGVISLATWTDNGYRFSLGVYDTDGLTLDAIRAIIEQVR